MLLLNYYNGTKKAIWPHEHKHRNLKMEKEASLYFTQSLCTHTIMDTAVITT